jgi:serpin B
MNHFCFRGLRRPASTLAFALGLLAPAWASAQTTPPPPAPATRLADLAAANNAFACDLYRQFAPAAGANAFFSPYSVETALATTWAGANGNTAAQMAKVLHLDALPSAQVTPAFGALQKALNDSEKKSGVQLAVANSLWPQQNHPILPEYLKTIQDDFASAIFPVDYKTQAEAARLRINAWVEDQTQKRIQNLLHPGDVADTTRLILVNAIYFKGNWAEKFDSANNLTAPFTLASGATQPATFMYKKLSGARYADVADAPVPLQILALPYQGGTLEFDALLPALPAALSDLEKKLTSENLTAWLGQLAHRSSVEVFLPKFKLNTRYALVAPLQKLGLADAFTDHADFSRMDGQQDLFIGNIVHQAFVEVNEDGTEAAAATGVVVRTLAVEASPPVFRADHPFLFLIRDTASGAILFLGRFATPTE